MKRGAEWLLAVFFLVMPSLAVELSDALDAPSLVWETGGDAFWSGQTETSYDGEDAVQSGDIEDSQESWLSTEVIGPGQIRFRWKTSSESEYDYLRFYADGAEQTSGLSGETDWQQVCIGIGTGTHVLKWKYSKDGSTSSGSDCGWVDQVVWTEGAPVIATEPCDAVVLSDTNVSFTVQVNGDAPLLYQWYEGKSGNTASPVSDATNAVYALSFVSTDTSCWVRISNAKGSADSRTAQIRIGIPVGTLADLQKIGSGEDGWTMAAAYVLTNNIDASASAFWNDDGTDDSVLEGFKPIGDYSNPFVGWFDGGGHAIVGLIINRPNDFEVGLFGHVDKDALVQNLGVAGVNVTGEYSGGLAGWSEGRIIGCFATGKITGENVGGLVGLNDDDGTVSQCYAVSSVRGTVDVGGLVGVNAGSLSESYAVPKADNSDSIGGLIGFDRYWAYSAMPEDRITQKSYWDVTAYDVDSSGGGEGLTSAQMRCQASFIGWNFDSVWDIQEGEGAPYLKRFAEGQTSHERLPLAVYPEGSSSVWSLRPTLTAEVATADCAYVNARWQIATNATFADARDWQGVAEDGETLSSPFQCRVPSKFSLDYETPYYWRVRVQTWYGMWSDWSSSSTFQVQKPLDTVDSGMDELSIWSNDLFSKLWQSDYLSHANDDFETAIQVSGTNCEARVLHAFTTVTMLADNADLRNLMAEFGYSFDEGLFAVTGAFAGVSSPLSNDAMDRLANKALPAIDSAIADLAEIPTNWTGTVALSATDFPVDETVYVDLGDVLYARASLTGVKAAVETAQGYDLTLDYTKTNVFRSAVAAESLNVTIDGDASEWTNTPTVLFGPKVVWEYAKIARSESQVYVLVRLADDVTASYLKVGVGSTSFRFNGLQKGTNITDTSDHAIVFYKGHVLEMAYDLSTEEQNKNWTLTHIDVGCPSLLPDAAPELAVVVDGDATEWSTVPVSPLPSGNGKIDFAKIARSGTTINVLVKMNENYASMSANDFYIEVATPSGETFSFSSDETAVTNACQNGVLEASFPIPADFLNQSLLLNLVEIFSFDGWKAFNWTSWDNASFEKKLHPVNQFLSDHPACLSTVRNPSKLVASKTTLKEALSLAVEADGVITNRIDGLMHFIEYDSSHAEEQNEARQRLNEALASMDAPQHVAYGGREADIQLGAFFDSPFVTRNLLPQLTDDDELAVGSFPDPSFNGMLPSMTLSGWQDELLGVIPLVKENAFTLEGQTFSTGGYAFWNKAEGSGTHTNVAQSGTITNACVTWVETAITGPGTLTFSWTVSSLKKIDVLSVYLDGVRQIGSISGDCDWGIRQLVLTSGTHRVRWAYVRNVNGGGGYDGGAISGLSWSAGDNLTSTDTPVRVPYAWLNGFSGLVVDGDYEAAALADQDGDGMKTWQEYAAGSSPTNAASVFLATVTSDGSNLKIGWTPDLSPERVYTVEGKPDLTDTDWGSTNAASRFFRVKVELP